MKRFATAVLILISLSFSVFAQVDRSKVEPRRGMVGIQLSEKNGEFFIAKVFKNSPAERAGLKSGDVILRVSEQDVSGFSLARVLNLFNGEPDHGVEVAVLRNGREIPPIRINRIPPKELYEKSPDIRTTNQNRQSRTTPTRTPHRNRNMPSQEEISSKRIQKWLDYFREIYGFQSVLLDDKFGEKLGAVFSEGLLVLDVQVGTPAFDSGLSKWDLIYRINGRSPNDLLSRSEAPEKKEKPVPLNITLMGLTGEKEMTVK
mgnify:CR=1 FL=1